MQFHVSKDGRTILIDEDKRAIGRIKTILFSRRIGLNRGKGLFPDRTPETAIFITHEIDSYADEIISLEKAGCVIYAIHPDQLNDETEQMMASLFRSAPGNIDDGSDTSDLSNVTLDIIKESFRNNEFFIVYQPVIETSTMRASGFESLVRWKWSATGELIPPDRFIPVIEDSDFMITFGFWIIDQVCRRISEWNTVLGIKSGFRIGINLSAKQFTCVELVDRIIGMIDEYGINPSQIALEITESAFMEQRDIANLMLLRLKAKKILIYLDDFGMGYSSLSYLLHFPVDVIKIDMSFVKWMHVDEQSEAIVRSVVSLAHNLKLRAVAEGVERDEHVVTLTEIGCDYMQGFRYSKPLIADEALRYLLEHS